MIDISQHLAAAKVAIDDIQIKKFIFYLLYGAGPPFITKHLYIDSLDIYRSIDIFAALDEPEKINLLFNNYDKINCGNIITKETDAEAYLSPEKYISYIQEKIKTNQFVYTYLLRSSLKAIELTSDLDMVPEAYSRRYNTNRQRQKTLAIKERIQKQLANIKAVYFFNNIALPIDKKLRLSRARFLIKLLVHKIAPLYDNQTKTVLAEINKNNLEKNYSIDHKVIELAKIIRTEANKEEKPLRKQIAYIAHEIILTQTMVNDLLASIAKKNSEDSYFDKKKEIMNWDRLGYFEKVPAHEIIEKLKSEEDILKIEGLTGKDLKKSKYVQFYIYKDNIEQVLKNEKIDYLKTRDKTKVTLLIKNLRRPGLEKTGSQEKAVYNIIEVLINENKNLIGKLFDPLFSLFRNKNSYLLSRWKEIERKYDELLRKKLRVDKIGPPKKIERLVKREERPIKAEQDLELTAKEEDELEIIKKILVDNFRKVEQKNIKEPDQVLPPTIDDFLKILKTRIPVEVINESKPGKHLKPKYLNYLDKYFIQIGSNYNKYLIPKNYGKIKLKKLIGNYDFFSKYALRKGNQELSNKLKSFIDEINKII